MHLDTVTRPECIRHALQAVATPNGVQVMSESYVTTYCNFPHRIRDGKPIKHACYVIPPKALAAEIAGNYSLACDLITKGKTFRQFGEPSLRPHSGTRA
jgi:hypothetical protein